MPDIVLKTRDELEMDGFELKTAARHWRAPSWAVTHFGHRLSLDQPAFVPNGDGAYLQLADSGALSTTAFVSEDLILGERYGFLHQRRILVGDQPLEAQLSLWDRRTGARLVDLDGHFGELLGWRWVGDGALATWGRDFLIRVWDAATGAQLRALPFPEFFAGIPPISVLDSRRFADLPGERQDGYLRSGRVAMEITHLLLSPCGHRCETLGPCRHPNVDAAPPRPAAIGGSFQELRNVEASYAEATTLSDGRLLIAPTTYGARGCCYVWDRGRRLTLILGRLLNGTSFYGLREQAPGVLRIDVGDLTEDAQPRISAP